MLLVDGCVRRERMVFAVFLCFFLFGSIPVVVTFPVVQTQKKNPSEKN